jgi:hypothetical protein
MFVMEFYPLMRDISSSYCHKIHEICFKNFRISYALLRGFLLVRNLKFFCSCYRASSSTCKIYSFHSGDYEECCLLGCYAVWLL